MEVLSCHSSPSSYIATSRTKLVEKGITSNRSKFLSTKPQILKYSNANQFHSKTLCIKVRNTLKGFQDTSTYVTDGESGQTSLTGTIESAPRVQIPSLPDDSHCNRSAVISSNIWEWKPKLNVYYEKSGSENVNSPPILLLPGFGVGSFHYEKQLKDLGRDNRVWALDFLGQGMSLPCEDPTGLSGKDNFVWGFGDETQPWAKELVFSVDLWLDQVCYFIEEVIKEPVYIAGNSLGGFVALSVAARNPELVKGVTLLNATPFWGFLPNPVRSPILSRIFPWSGTFPLPSNVRKIVEFVWKKISAPESIGKILEQVYADHSTNVDNVFSCILETIQHPAAPASLASILFAPRGQMSFIEALEGCKENNLPVCLVYGKEDPWVNPVWGLQVKKYLPRAPYYQISPAGHCPHDEVPEVVNYLMRGWIKNLESKGSSILPLLDNEDGSQFSLAKDVEFTRGESKKLVKVRFYGSDFSIRYYINSFLMSKFQDIRTKFQY